MNERSLSEHEKAWAEGGPPRRPPGRLAGASVALVAVGAALCGVLLLGDEGATRLGFAWLWGFAFVWAVGLGSLFFVALHHLVGAVWSAPLRRVAEMFASALWIIAILFVPVLVFALMNDRFAVFAWLDAERLAHDPLLAGKRGYLNLPSFAARAGAYFALWIGFAAWFVRRSLRQDRLEGADGAVADALAMRRASAPFMVVFAFTATFAGIDWLMSLEPNWFSTIFGVYVFSGMMLTALAAITLAAVWLRATGRIGRDLLGDDHLYSLGALLFAFSCFWGYIAFSQYMLIWYANLPEESFYMVRRTEGGWLAVSAALATARFVVPFLVLLPRRAKMDGRVLLGVSVLVLLGQLLDLYWLVLPAYHREQPGFGAEDLGPPLLMVGLLGLWVWRFLARHRCVCIGDPMLERARRFHL